MIDSFLRGIAEGQEIGPLMDWLEERGRGKESLAVKAGLLAPKRFPVDVVCGYEYDGGYVDGSDGGCGYGYGDGGSITNGGYGDGGSITNGGYGDGGGGGYGGGGDGGGGASIISVQEGLEMRDGFQIISVISGHLPYVVVGWATVDGFDVTMRNCRVIRRYGQNKSLSELAVEGPMDGDFGTKLLEMSKYEEFFRPLISRSIPAAPSAWRSECPKPRERKRVGAQAS